MCNNFQQKSFIRLLISFVLVASLRILIIVKLKLSMSCPTVHVRMLCGRLRILEEVEKKQTEKEIRIAEYLRQGLYSVRCWERCQSLSVVTSLLTVTLLCVSFPALRSRVIFNEDVPFQVIYKVLLLSCQFQCCSHAWELSSFLWQSTRTLGCCSVMCRNMMLLLYLNCKQL